MSEHSEPSGRGAADVAWVLAAQTGDGAAFGELYARWIDRVHDVARNIVRNPDTADEVAQDAFVTAWQQLDRLEQPEAFGGWLLRIARNRALDRLARENRSRPTDGDVVTDLHDRGGDDPFASRRGSGDLSEVIADLDRDGLVDAAAIALGERDASLLDLHLRHGLTPAEIAAELGVTPNTAHQQLFRMRARLGATIGSLVLWRSGRPQCSTLAGLVSADGRFDADVASVVERHQRTCAECTDRRALLTSPTELFAALPIATLPIAAKLDIYAALRAAGVPVGDPPAGLIAERSGIYADAAGDGAAGDGAAGDGAGGDGAGGRDGGDGADAGAGGAGGDGLDTAGDRDEGSGDGGGLDALTAALGDPSEAIPVGPDDESSSRRRAWWWWTAAAILIVSSVGVAVVLRASARDSGADLAVADAVGVTTGAARSGTPPPLDELAEAPAVPASTTSTSVPAPTTEPALAIDTIAPLDTVAGQSGDVATNPPATTRPAVTTVAPTATSPPTPPPTAPPTTGPPATAPPATVPSTTSPPTTVAPTTAPPTTTTTTTTAPPPPRIVSFTQGAGSNSLICTSPTASPREFNWSTTLGTSATLTTDGVTRSVPLSGPRTYCGTSGSTATLVVANAGGSVQQSIVLP
jgi:RNA polymerase sigma factor (sigma-70 family)